ncbi:unnamed protein product [Dracunculus medinensis]|uniref:BH4_AAA_HYDROXYL_2 domain-containing protein n=1 Tax=Dracunculus medinensis TaxID=318479 RepID=A0A0N4UNQ5_DRAME|nr:unnamed protein product [Dracunculus medinensis]
MASLSVNLEVWFPHYISDLDKCSLCVIKYEPTTDPRHPGYGDKDYISRRIYLNEIAKSYRYDQPLPEIEYTEEEHKTWKIVFSKLKSLYETYACAEYRHNLADLENTGLFVPDRIPNLREVNNYLQKKTGFMLRPCAGLLSARDFLASLAFRVFQTTLYLRHPKSPHHSPEPDLIHEFIGHCPMFADPIMAQFSQEIGLLSLGASDEQIEQLATVYWFIIEFGLCYENGQLKAIGAGLLSSYGELMHACSDKPNHVKFEPEVTALQKFNDADYQPTYFVANSIFDAIKKLRFISQVFRDYARTMKRSHTITYDPITKCINVIKNVEDILKSIERLKQELSIVSDAIDHVSKNINTFP